jgi:hypothetical protein
MATGLYFLIGELRVHRMVNDKSPRALLSWLHLSSATSYPVTLATLHEPVCVLTSSPIKWDGFEVLVRIKEWKIPHQYFFYCLQVEITFEIYWTR